VIVPLILEQRVFGLPVAQGRPRARHFQDRSGATRVSVFDPSTSRDWKRTVLAQCLDAKPLAPVEGPLAMHLEFYLPRGVSLPKRVVHHVTKPDVSNLCKAVEDALCGVIYRDDKQIVSLTVEKRYSPAPGVLIRLERVHDAPKPEPQQQPLLTTPA
jgi:Holliday junction resolvase RusA-like endonuclease